ncbi:uncharacterized protein [Bemisia tabaci]|uniref:uncharacterized protein isoform X2 n=1 Tax=Bemisia tabaci TaxID=7038 RepID=UPI003B2858D2
MDKYPGGIPGVQLKNEFVSEDPMKDEDEHRADLCQDALIHNGSELNQHQPITQNEDVKLFARSWCNIDDPLVQKPSVLLERLDAKFMDSLTSPLSAERKYVTLSLIKNIKVEEGEDDKNPLREHSSKIAVLHLVPKREIDIEFPNTAMIKELPDSKPEVKLHHELIFDGTEEYFDNGHQGISTQSSNSLKNPIVVLEKLDPELVRSHLKGIENSPSPSYSVPPFELRIECVGYVPESLSYLFRPVEDCSICLNVSQVDKVSDISPSEFEQRYVGPGRPVVVVDGSRGWSAVQVFDFDFFRRVYRESDHNWESQAACQFFPYKTEFQQLRDVFNMDPARANMSEGTQPWYVGWSNCDERVSRILREHYEPPYFLPQTSENKQTDWIFMGSPGYGAKMHIDNVNYPSWQAQLKGTKTWTLQPPLECFYKCNTLVVDVHPGEIIVLDTNRWYHQTQITSKDLSITIGAEFD